MDPALDTSSVGGQQLVYLGGLLFVWALLAAGMAGCHRISLRPGTNAKCVWSLFTVQAGILFGIQAGGIWIIQDMTSDFSRPVFILLSLFFLPALGLSLYLLLTSLILAMLGMIEWRRTPGVYARGKAAALVTFSIHGLFFLGLIGNLGLDVRKTEKQAYRPPPILPDTPPFDPQPEPLAGGRFHFDGLNTPWQPHRFRPGETAFELGYVQFSPDISFRVSIIPDLTQMGTEDYRRIYHVSMLKAYPECRFTKTTAQTVNGLQGLAFAADWEQNGQHLFECNWMGATNGYLCQMTGKGQWQDRRRIQINAKEAWQSLHFSPVENPDKAAAPVSRQPK